MAEHRGRWTDNVRPLPGGWMLKIGLIIVFVALVVSDMMNGNVDLTSPRGWFELALPYIPLLALLAGALAGAAAWLVVFTVVLSFGAPPLLISAMIFPMIIVVGLVNFALSRRAAWAFSAIVLALVVVAWVANPEITNGLVFFGLLAVCAVAAGLTANNFRTRAERDAHDVEQLREEQARIRIQERTQLAHELHDIVAHDVTIIAMQARRAEFVNDPENTAKILEGIGEAASRTLQDLRSLVLILKVNEQHEPGAATETAAAAAAEPKRIELHVDEPSGVTTTAEGLIHDIRNVVDALERAGFRVQLDVQGTIARVPASLRQVLRRTVKELGTNILKHADSADEVRLQLVVSDNNVTLSSTNGISDRTPVSSSQTGIEAMRARCEVFGGRVFAESKAGTWLTTMTIPLDKRTTAETAQGALI